MRLDPDEGIAIIQYQGRPYLVAIRHIRPHVQTYLNNNDGLKLNDKAEDELFDLMKMSEGVPPYNKRFLGHLPEHKVHGVVWRQVPGDGHFDTNMYQKLHTISLSLTSRSVSGMIYGRSMKFIKPPRNTTGYLITWNLGSVKYHIQEHWSADPIKMKKVAATKQDDICAIYLFYHVTNQEEATSIEWKKSKPMETEQSHVPQPDHSPGHSDGGEMDVEKHGVKRDGMESRTVTMAPEKKKPRTEYWSSHSVCYNASSLHYLMERRQHIKLGVPDSWTGTQLWAENDLTNRLFSDQEQHQRQCCAHQNSAFLFHIGASQDSILHVDLRTSDVWRVDTEHDDISEQDVFSIWPQVEEADRNEVSQFVQAGAFRKLHRDAFTDDMVIIDARWVRKYKKTNDGKKKVKSRLCARGCLDKQKDMLTTRSTTATRLSQRLLLSTAAVFDFQVESWDIAGAFLKGLNFNEIRRMLRKMGVNSPVRQVVLLPPPNVWRHLASLCPDFAVRDPSQWGLLCLKPVYGLNDAPLAWQLCLREYLTEIQGVSSVLDENSWRWKGPDNSIAAVCTCHVDDIALAAPQSWLDEHYEAFVRKFKKVSRQRLPFEHCGAKYERIPDGYRMIQNDFCAKMVPAKISSDRKDSDRLSAEETTSYRSILGALLWLTATRLDLISDVSHLATHVTSAEIKHLRRANQVLKRAQDKDFIDVGLYFRKLDPRKGLRLACFHDSSSHTKEKAYAHEGVLIMLMEDHVKPRDGEYDITCTDAQAQLHGGHAHVLWSHGAKAKRISYSTSHAETLASISGHEAAVLVSVRISEMLHQSRQPTLQQLAAIQEAGNPQLAIDDYGDCNDVFQLVTGCKTLPQDKSQRIYVLSLRESRLAGRIRWMILTPTRSMAADALTKPMLSKQMMMILTSGVLEMQNKETHHIQMKRLPPKCEIEEQDLETEDPVLIQKYEKEKMNPGNLWWTPMFAAFKRGMFPFAALLVLSSLPGAYAADDMVNHGSLDNTLFYALAFFTVAILVFERFAMQLGSRFLAWAQVTISRQSSLSSASPIARSNQSSMASARSSMALASPTMESKTVQTTEHKTNRLWNEHEMSQPSSSTSFELRYQQVEQALKEKDRELTKAMDEITKMKQTIQKNTTSYMQRIKDMQKQNDVLRNQLGMANAPKLDSEHVPEQLFYTPHGECFHVQSCPALCNTTGRPFKLAKCKRCF